MINVSAVAIGNYDPITQHPMPSVTSGLSIHAQNQTGSYPPHIGRHGLYAGGGRLEVYDPLTPRTHVGLTQGFFPAYKKTRARGRCFLE